MAEGDQIGLLSNTTCSPRANVMNMEFDIYMLTRATTTNSTTISIAFDD